MKIDCPKISVIIPSFNQAQYIEQTILSVINQSYNNFELIVIDGGSKDESAEIIKKYSKHLTYWISEEDKGQSDAINKGLAKASGDIITWLNSDDEYYPDTFKIIAENFASKADASIIHGKSVLHGQKLKEKIIGSDKTIEQFEYLSSMKFPQPSSFLSRDAFLALAPVNAQLHYCMDFELVVKAVLSGFKIYKIENVLSRYRMHENSKSNNELKFLEEWGVIVYQALSSLPNGKEFALHLKELGLISGLADKTYSINIRLVEKEIQEVFLEHLHLQYHYNYRHGKYDKSRLISSYIKNHHADYYKKLSFKKYDLRSDLVPKFLLKLLRK